MDVASRCSLIIQHAVSHSFIVSSTLHSQCRVLKNMRWMTSCWLSKVETKRELKVEQMVEFRTAKVSTSARKFLELWSMRNSWTTYWHTAEQIHRIHILLLSVFSFLHYRFCTCMFVFSETLSGGGTKVIGQNTTYVQNVFC